MDTGTTDEDRNRPTAGDESPASELGSTQGTVTVLGFGPLRDQLSVSLSWDGGTVEELLATLAERYPEVKDWIPQAVVLVDGAKRDSADSIRPGSRVELLPPISGG